MDSTVFHNSLLAVLIGSFLVFIVCVLCIGAASDRGLCCRDASNNSNLLESGAKDKSSSSATAECICDSQKPLPPPSLRPSKTFLTTDSDEKTPNTPKNVLKAVPTPVVHSLNE
ncbi:unnamed protein product [Auanema sp. JU1783]|nr:unnamed protein product [Auanema sp. JU1783]